MSDVHVLGIRHHGPGSARSVLGALEELQPDLVLIEGAPELDALIPLAADPGLVPPVAGLVYAVDSPRRAIFYPLAVFSPEWVALRWSLAHGANVKFADLPATHMLADSPSEGPDGSEPSEVANGEQAQTEAPHRPDAIAALAQAAGYDDPERWWEDAVEHRRTSSLEQFAALNAAMAAVRASHVSEDENDRREAAMRRAIRAGAKAGHSTIAFVCGAYHGPALNTASVSATADNRLLAGLPKAKVAATWAPWTAGRLATSSGYGAGVRSPGWYQHLFVSPDDEVVAGWMVRVARTLRDEQLDASPGSVVEATRLAEALSAVRGRPSVGLAELEDATRAVLADGSDLPLRLVDRSLVVGEQLGRVPSSTPMVPLAADLARQQRSLRLKPSAAATTVQLDLRREAQLARSVLLHRLLILDVPWGQLVDAGRTTGTFKEAWQLEWQPELAVCLIEASLWGNTVRSAAEARIEHLAAAAPDLATLAGLVESCFTAELPNGLTTVVKVLAKRTALQHDTLSLLGAIEPLARTCRYGDVRGADAGEVARVLETVIVRAAVGLRAACVALDDDAAAEARAAIEAAQRGVALLEDAHADLGWARTWWTALAAVAGDPVVHGAVSGRVNRVLLDAGRLDAGEAARRMARRLSVGSETTTAAAWLDGFLAGDALLLLHDEVLLGIIDAWVSDIAETTFEDLLPLLRRTFSRYAPPERREIGRHVRQLGTGRDDGPGIRELDLERALPAVHATARLLGLEVTT